MIQVLINGHELGQGLDFNEIAVTLFSMILNQAHLMSGPNLRENINGCLDVLEEIAVEDIESTKDRKGPSRARATRKLRKVSTWRTCISRSDNKSLVKWVWNTICSADGKGLLHGYGFTNRFGDRVYGDPERNSSLGYNLVGTKND